MSWSGLWVIHAKWDWLALTVAFFFLYLSISWINYAGFREGFRVFT